MEKNIRILGNSGALTLFPFLKHLPGDWFEYKRLKRDSLSIQGDYLDRINEHRCSHLYKWTQYSHPYKRTQIQVIRIHEHRYSHPYKRTQGQSSGRTSVHLWTELCLQQYWLDPFHTYVYTWSSNFRSSVACDLFLQNSRKIGIWGIFLICNFDFVLLWLRIWYEAKVWVIMGQRGYSQNKCVLVALVRNNFDLEKHWSDPLNHTQIWVQYSIVTDNFIIYKNEIVELM